MKKVEAKEYLLQEHGIPMAGCCEKFMVILIAK